MHCPVCETDMIIQELDQTEVDYCVDCHGIWLDQGELEMLLESGTEDPLMATFRRVTAVEKPRRCPVCKTLMEKVYAGAEANPVLIDRCPKHHGLWFDAGELHLLLETSDQYSGSKLAQLLKGMFPDQADQRSS